MPTPTRSKRLRSSLSPEDRDKRRADDKQRVEQAVRRLRSTEGWRSWLRVRAVFRSYSAHNCMLIAMQCPHAERIAPFTSWNRLGRYVRRGERAIAINIYNGSFTVDNDDVTQDAIPRFRLKACLFDISQTDGEPLAELPQQPVEGDSHKQHLSSLERLATDHGYSVVYQSVAGTARGYCDPSSKRIVVESDLPANGRVRVLVHEIAHALGIGYGEYGRSRAETLVESITFIVCRGIGLDTSGESVPYIALWDEDGLASLSRFAQAVDQAARTIETALHDDECVGDAPRNGA